MNTKHQTSTKIESQEINTHGHWIKGEISIRTTLGEDNLSNPHFDQNLDVSVWLGDEGKNAIHIDRNTWVYLSGIMGEGNYSNTELLRGEFTLAELRLISQTLNLFLTGLETGEISSK